MYIYNYTIVRSMDIKWYYIYIYIHFSEHHHQIPRVIWICSCQYCILVYKCIYSCHVPHRLGPSSIGPIGGSVQSQASFASYLPWIPKPPDDREFHWGRADKRTYIIYMISLQHPACTYLFRGRRGTILLGGCGSRTGNWEHKLGTYILCGIIHITSYNII